MKAKTSRIIYWVVTIIFALAMFMDGIGGITRAEAGKEVMQHLGYPEYALTIFGVAKILGAIAILQTRYKTIKEWAFAGFAINFTGAAASRAYAGDGAGMIMMPLVMLIVMFVVYYFWKRTIFVTH